MSALLDSLATGFSGDAARRAVLEDALRDGLPGPRAEAWKYTSLRQLERRSFAPVGTLPALDPMLLAGIPGPRAIRAGDIVGFDIGAIWEGYHADAARTFAVGEVDAEARRLMQVTRAALQAGIEQARVGNRLSDISHAIQTYVEKHNYSVVRDYCGHGIGKVFHDAPSILHYGDPGTGVRAPVSRSIA